MMGGDAIRIWREAISEKTREGVVAFLREADDPWVDAAADVLVALGGREARRDEQYWAAVEGAVRHSLRAAALWDPDGQETEAELFARLDPEWRPVLQTYQDGSARVVINGTVMAIVQPPEVMPRHTMHTSLCEAARASRRK
jgi:hypothetical protein